ncbi:MAG TPA: VCBS repeat-containing protein, partial [Chloroflexi bacterium]|nr:VCBS repeat-containing protein [Chloroflexota bacterium]
NNIAGNVKDISWWENSNGDASAWTHHTVDPDFANAHSVYPADFDGDQDIDILGSGTGRLNWWENSNGAGTVWQMRSIVTFTVGGHNTTAVAADVNGDGNTDVISSSYDDATLAWHENQDGVGGSWQTRVISDQLTAAGFITPIDLDADSDTDLLNINGRQIMWWENSGNGGSWTPHVVEQAPPDKTSISAADLDNDSDLDIVGVAPQQNSIFWWEANGAPENLPPPNPAPLLAEQPPIDLNPDNIYDLAAADLDNDGDQDLIASGYVYDYSPAANHQLVWLENIDPANNRFLIRTTYISIEAVDVFAADVDGDGRTDIISLGRNSLNWHENLGGAPPTFAYHTITNTLSTGTAVFAADLDGNGAIDIAIAERDINNKITWFQNNGSSAPAFTAHTVAAANYPLDIYAADANGDSNLDLITANYDDNAIVLYENDGSATPSFTARVIDNSAVRASGVYAADFDGDTDTDILAASRGDNTIAWYENDGAQPPGFTYRIITNTLSVPRKVQVTDLNHDGRLDVLATTGDSVMGDGEVLWFANDGAQPPGFAAHPIADTQNIDPVGIAVDFSGNGRPQIVVGSLDNYQNKRPGIQIGVNDGSAAPAFPLRPVLGMAKGSHDIQAADLDNDGDLDPIVATLYDGLNWYPQETMPARHFLIQPVSSASLTNHAVFPADLDGDGDTDFAAAAYADDTIAWYENDGNVPPAFASHVISDTAVTAKYVHVDDLDGDQDLDIIATLKNPNTLLWFANDGGSPPIFTSRVISDTIIGPRSVYTGDLDNDGDRDIVTASFGYDNAVAGAVYWFENDGATPPSFTPHTLVSPVAGAHGTFIADLDDDGNADILYTSVDGSVVWLENNGQPDPIFIPHSLELDLERPLFVKAADMDGDGDMDVLVSSRNDNTIAWYENTERPSPNKFVQRLITDRESKVMGIHPADIDGDNDPDLLVASINPGKVGWWRNQYAPWQIGGAAIAPAALNAGQSTAVLRLNVTHTGQPADLPHELAAIAFRLEDAAMQPVPDTAVSTILSEISLYLDDGSGNFEAGNDAQIATAVPVTATVTFTFAPNDPPVYLPPGQTRVYFVIATLSNNAHQQPWRDIRLTHLRQASQSRYAGYDNAPRLLPGADVSAGPIHILSPDGWETALYLPVLLKP